MGYFAASLLGLVGGVLAGFLGAVLHNWYISRKPGPPRADADRAKRQRIGIIVAAVVVGIVAGAGTAFFSRNGDDKPPSTSIDQSTTTTNTEVEPTEPPTSTLPPTIPPTVPPTAPPGPSASFSSPTEGQEVSVQRGIQANGRVSGVAQGQTLWLLDFDGQTFTADERALVVGDQWSAKSVPLGDSSEVLPFNVTEVVVLADSECDAFLAALTVAADSTFNDLPPGCTPLAQVTVTASQP